MEMFWENHDPFLPSRSLQYKSLILYHDEEQRRIIEETKQEVEARYRRTARTVIEPYSTFTDAEDYHQKYFLQQDRTLLKCLDVSPSSVEFIDNPAASKLNGYVGGYGSLSQFTEELEGPHGAFLFESLSEKGKQRLDFLFRKSKRL